MAKVVRTEWFGKRVAVLTVAGKSLTGELLEVTDNYVILATDSGTETQVMVHAIVAIALAAPREGQGKG